jgi:hypothetical protein
MQTLSQRKDVLLRTLSVQCYQLQASASAKSLLAKTKLS